MHRIICLFVFLLTTVRGQIEEESCVHDFTNTIGYCTLLSVCQTAREDYIQSRIPPKYCSYNASGDRLICCRDGSNALNSDSNRPQDGWSIWGNAEQLNDRRRISERTIGWEYYGTYKFRCVGSLISSLYVVTAAVCSRDGFAEKPEPVIVRLGNQNIDNSFNNGANPIDVAIRRMIKHPDHQSPKLYNDIALFELVAEVSFNSAIRPVCLWTKTDLTRYRTVIATGWGRINISDEDISYELQKATLQLLDLGFCNEIYKPHVHRNFRNGIIDSQICAGGLNGGKVTGLLPGAPIHVVSQGNSRVIYIVGLSSFGKGCAIPTVHTRIWSYLDWIESIVWPGQ